MATYPEGWKLQNVLRWGDQQNTLTFAVASDDDPEPKLYYRVYRQPRRMTADELTALIREEARKKEQARRESYGDYRNHADSFRVFALGEQQAFSWRADFTAANGEQWAEYFVRIQNEHADASFFLQPPIRKLNALCPAVDAFMASLKMPRSE